MVNVDADEAKGYRLRKKARIFLLMAVASAVFAIFWFVFLNRGESGLPSSFWRVLLNLVFLFAPLMLLAQAWGTWVEGLAIPRRHRTAIDYLVLASVMLLAATLLFFSVQQAVNGILYGTVRLRHGVIVNVSDHPIIYGVYESIWIICVIFIIIAAVRFPRTCGRWRKQTKL
jgi:hypothetical protein